MDIFLTFDYELFFGKQHGTAQKCLIEPSDLLSEIARKHQIRLTFFVDVGYLVQLEKYKSRFSELEVDYQTVVTQLKTLVEAGHDCQLHIHPHWQDCTYSDGNWNMNTTRYKLSDFNQEEATTIIKLYKNTLEAITGQPAIIFRAGGWCLQPFSHVESAFAEVGIKLDSSTFYEGKNLENPYYYDFTAIPKKSAYPFSSQVETEDSSGQFTELPIAAYDYSFLFFWKLFAWGRLHPKNHKPMGDGYPITTPGLRKKYLTRGLHGAVSCDGYFAGRLNRAFDFHREYILGNEFVVIGHPKACTLYSLRKLDAFIKQHKSTHRFISFSRYLQDQKKTTARQA